MSGVSLRVVLFGLGHIGAGAARLLAARDDCTIVGAVCRRPENDGRDIGELAGIGRLGVTASLDEDAVLDSVEADVALHATKPWLTTVEPELARLVEAGLNVVTLTEEAAYPWGSHPEESRRLDALARLRGVSILATGVNPGFIWDTLPAVLTLGSAEISKIRLRRRTTLSFLSDATLAQMGIGLSREDFDAAVACGDVIGHLGTRQSVELLGAALGWNLGAFAESLSCVVDEDAEPPRVCGFRQVATATFDSGTVDVLLEPRLGLAESVDEIELVGTPPRLLRIEPAVEPIATAQAVAVNALPAVVEAEPGFRTMLDLPLPSARLRARRPNGSGVRLQEVLG